MTCSRSISAAVTAMMVLLAGRVAAQEQAAPTISIGTTRGMDCPLSTIYFDFNAFALDDEAAGALRENMELLGSCLEQKEARLVHLRITGHCDRRGRESHNRTLGWKRALTVKEHLVGLGLPEEVIELESKGSAAPVCQTETAECHRQNRRVEFFGSALVAARKVVPEPEVAPPAPSSTEKLQGEEGSAPQTRSPRGIEPAPEVRVEVEPEREQWNVIFFLGGGVNTFVTSTSREAAYPPYVLGEVGVKTPGLLLDWLDLTGSVVVGRRADGTVVLNERSEHATVSVLGAQLAAMASVSSNPLYVSVGPELRYQWSRRELLLSSSPRPQENLSMGAGVAADAGYPVSRHLYLGGMAGVGALGLSVEGASDLHWYVELVGALWYRP